MGVGVEAKPTMSITVSLFCAPLTAGFYATQKQSLPNYYYCSICPSSTQCPPPPKNIGRAFAPSPLQPTELTHISPRFPISQFTSLTCVLHVPFIILVLDTENTNHHAVFCTPLLQNSRIYRFSHDLSCDAHLHSSKSFIN